MSSLDQAEQAGTTLRVPERAALEGLEETWMARWDAAGTYRFDRSAARSAVYAIDTPPPTVSGSLHIGHVFSYTQTDVIARYLRMRGRAVFYPIGWDDNGLATERRVQNYFGVRCDPSVPYDPGFRPPEPGASNGQALAVSRPNFVELCQLLTTEDEQAFEALFRRLALSVDWSFTYTTISPRARRASQLGFLHLLERGHAYRQEAPTLWDVDFQTAVAQAELVERERPGAYHRLRFGRPGGGGVEVETTRPELLPACVALVAHPDDERYRPLFGSSARTPLFGVDVPILPHRLAAPDKGSGIAMVCTFGDLTDVTWWRELALPTRNVIGRDGRLLPTRFGAPGFESADPERADASYAQLAGKTVNQARREIVELLRASGDLVGEPTEITHAVKFYENGERPLEVVTSPQWYVRTMRLADELIAAGRRLDWHPAFMRARYEDWVNGLTGDWNISRQRFFGVPFPVWYPLGEDGEPDESRLIVATPESLPVDPSSDVPPGYTAEQRGRPGGFIGDPDVMDTWATSSLSPQIAGGWVDDPQLFSLVFPMHLRPQAHDIIRTWLFTTVVRSLLEHETLPWESVALSGWILDPDRKKMSKSKGNVVTPMGLLEKHGTDAVRYWAASARLGKDTTFEEQQMVVGRRLALKVLNASRFVLGTLAARGAGEADGEALASGRALLQPLDAALLAHLDGLVGEATSAFEDYEYARALERTEHSFWMFCDDYLELVKARAQVEGAGGESARHTLRLALDVLLRLLAPVLPYACEEAWSWSHTGSIHLAAWPERGELAARAAEALGTGEPPPEGLLDATVSVLGEVRRAKADSKRSLKAPVASVVVSGPPALLALVALARADLVAAGTIGELVLEPDAGADGLAVRAELA